ncbi:MAG TPA: GAF domain-containing sensor histidine kinase [Actinomycetota bacterium]|nr:GAF domain-containing sensor histidine kinase [Actinomycetota bacterium]
MTAQPTVAPASVLATWAGLVRRRLHEPTFWAVQAGVLSITALHLAIEGLGLFRQAAAVESGLHHVPVVLYLVPIVYAGLRYGFEGSVLTGAWSLVLTLPNVFLWHRRGFAWTGELLYAALVLGVGGAVAVPVERERRQRERLEATGRRLALLHQVASALVSASPLDRVLPIVLERVREVLGLRAVVVVVRDPDHGGVEGWSVPEGVALAEGADRVEPSGVDAAGADGCVRAQLGPEPESVGVLVGAVEPGREPGREDEDLLRAVAAQIGVAIENDRLHRAERERLRSYVHEVTRAHEEERKHLARELHDTAAQDLVILQRGLDALAERLPPEAAQRVRELRSRAVDTLEGLRRLSRDLRPTVLDDLGLVPALEWLVADLERRTGIEARFRTSGAVRRLPAETEVALFRITQEALRNVERHAQARRVEVRVAFGDHEVRVEVRDDGCGFEVPAPLDRLALQGRLGLLGMRERAQLVGGTLAVRSAVGEGAEVAVTVPWSPPPTSGA